MLFQQIVNGIVVGSVYALTAMGATLVYGIMRILDISNAGAYAIGAYVSFFFLLQTGSPVVALVMGVALTAVFGFLVQKFLYEPLMNKSPNVSLIAGIGLFIFLQDFLRCMVPYSWRYRSFTADPLAVAEPFTDRISLAGDSTGPGDRQSDGNQYQPGCGLQFYPRLRLCSCGGDSCRYFVQFGISDHGRRTGL